MIRVGFLFAPTMLRDTLDRGRLPLKLIFKSLCFSMPIASYRLLKQFKTCNGKCKRRAIRLSRLLKQPVVLLLVKFPEIALLADCAIGHFKQAMVRFPESKDSEEPMPPEASSKETKQQGPQHESPAKEEKSEGTCKTARSNQCHAVRIQNKNA